MMSDKRKLVKNLSTILIVVVSFLVLLFLSLLPEYSRVKQLDRKRMTQSRGAYAKSGTEGLINWLAAGIRVYYFFHQEFPMTNDLQRNLEKGGVFFSEKPVFPYNTTDFWGNEIQYYFAGTTARLVSAGADCRIGTSDDICGVIVVDGNKPREWNLYEEGVLSNSLEHRKKGSGAR